MKSIGKAGTAKTGTAVPGHCQGWGRGGCKAALTVRKQYFMMSKEEKSRREFSQVEFVEGWVSRLPRTCYLGRQIILS